MCNGWIRLYRSVDEHWIFEREDYLAGWIKLLLLAGWKDRVKLVEGKPYVIPRGSFIESQRSLAAKWGWNRKKIEGFMQVLEGDHMIRREGDHRFTHYYIINYDSYNPVDEGKGTTEGTTSGATKGPPRVPRQKKDKNLELDLGSSLREVPISSSVSSAEPIVVLKQYGKHLRMTEEEFGKLTGEFTQPLVEQELEPADLWVERTQSPQARRYRKPGHNHYLFFRGWLQRSSLKRQPAPGRGVTANGTSQSFDYNMSERDRLLKLEREGKL